MKTVLLMTLSMTLSMNMCSKETTSAEAESPQAQMSADGQTETTPVKEAKKKTEQKPKAIKANFSGTKLHPQKQYCVWYEHTGQMMSGTSQICSRKYGQESFTITNTSVGMMGIVQTQNQHSIIKGKKIININLDSKIYTVADNPIYDRMSKADAKKLGQAMMDALNMQDTGTDKTIVGTQCNVLTSQFGTGCYTDSMIMLEQDVMGNKQTATKIDLKSGGPNAGYNRHKQGDVKEGESVDLDAIMKQMGRQ